jgi:antitoxin MazE
MGVVYTSFRHPLRATPMSEAVLDIKRWGNSLGVRLPAAVARAAHLKADQRVRVTVEDGRVVIVPDVEPALSLQARLARFDPARHGGEAMPAVPIGAERW